MNAAMIVIALLVAACGRAVPGLPPDDDDSGDAGATMLDAAPDAYVAPTGDGVWARLSTGTGIPAFKAIAADSDGSVVVVGTFTSPIDFGSGFVASRGGPDIFVVKVDAAGTPLWLHSFGSCASDEVASVAIAPDHSILVYGVAYFDTGSGSCRPVFAGGPIAATLSASATMLVLVRYGADGTEQWAKAYGTGGSTSIAGAMALGGDAIAITGNSTYGVDFSPTVMTPQGGFVTVLGLDGVGRWARSFNAFSPYGGIAIDDHQVTVATTMNGAAEIGAAAPVVPFGSSDDLLVAYDVATDAYLWHQHLGGTMGEFVRGLSTAPDGSLWIAGYFWGSAHFGGGTLSVSGPGSDGFGARFTAAGVPIASMQSGVTPNEELTSCAAVSDRGMVEAGAKYDASLGQAQAVFRRLDANANLVWEHVLAPTTQASVIARASNGDLVSAGFVGANTTIALPNLTPVTNGAVASGFIVRMKP